MEKAVNDIVISGFVGAVIVMLFKVLWDWMTSGRTEKGVYMLIQECEKRRSACGLLTVEDDLQEYSIQCAEYKATTDTRLKEIDKQLDSGRADFIRLIDDISQIKQRLAAMPTFEEFQGLQGDMAKIMNSITRIQTVLEFALEKRGNGQNE
jgi:seryl-tRNA synthetase